MFLNSTRSQALIDQLAPLRKEQVCAIIPAAGKGSRLGYNKPKILYDFGGFRPLDILHQRLSSLVDETIFVVSTHGRQSIVEATNQLDWVAKFTVQEEPLGMAHAILQAKELAKKFEHILIVWGDQVAIQSTTINAALKLHDHFQENIVTAPLVYKSSPYISLEWDQSGNLETVLQARGGDTMPKHGFNDCGVFVARSKPFLDFLEKEWHGSSRAKEFDLLPLLPNIGGSILGFVVEGDFQTVGLNTTEDASLLKGQLSQGKTW